MIGYKGFTKDLTCKGFQFIENKTFEILKPLKICENGFHFCDVPLNVLNYYNNSTDKYAIIEALGEIQYSTDKLVTNKIRIVKVINRLELESECGNNSYYTKSGEYHFKNNLLHRDNDLPARIYSNGYMEWYLNGQLHRDNDKPALVNYDQFWYKNGKLHRENDLPAIISYKGDQAWYIDGISARENDLPSIICANGTRYWYGITGYHRENDKPAIICNNGDQSWYKNNKYHRDNNKPAIILNDNSKIYYTNGTFCMYTAY